MRAIWFFNLADFYQYVKAHDLELVETELGYHYGLRDDVALAYYVEAKP